MACLYVPDRQDPDPRAERQAPAEICITPLSPTEALIELVCHSFIVHLVQGLGWQPRRMRLLAEVVATIPIRRLVYPSGYEYLPAVAEAIVADQKAATR